jgi:hypothetical protein
MDKIFEQFKVQDSGCTDEKCAVEFGKMLSVQRIMISSVGLVGQTYTVQVRLVDVESSKIIRSVSRKLEGRIDGVIDLLPQMGYELLTGPKVENITIESIPPGASVAINGKPSGTTPLREYQIVEGDHKLSLRLSGYESHRQILTVKSPQNTIPGILLIPKSKHKAFTKSLFVPGRGQWYADHKAKGALISILQLATIAGVVGASLSAQNANNEYEDAKEDYQSITLSEKWRLGASSSKMYDSYDKASDASKLQYAAIGAAIAVYAWNLLDAALTEPKVEVKISDRSFVPNGLYGVSLAVRF